MTANIHVVTASAGAGKTTRIVSDIAQEVVGRPPEQVVATTFTIKAAAELIERARSKLFELGQPQLAARLLGARFGTVNAVCGRIVSDFALDLGRSPSNEVIPDEGASRIFNMAADQAIGRHAPTLNRLAERFGHRDPIPPGRERPDWRRTVRQIISQARANGLDTEGLRRSLTLSEQGFVRLLPVAAADGAALDAALSTAVSAALQLAPSIPSAKLKDHLTLLRSVHGRQTRGERITWSDWARLTKVCGAPTKDGRPFVALLDEVCRAAGRHSDHPGLREDCLLYIQTIFVCAAEALDAFQAFKAERGLLDFTDQEALALEVLRDPELAARLGEQVGRIFVDEFQDSSPLQLALFSALAGVVEASTWVGDPKQAIYGFRGADSELTQAAFLGAASATSGPADSLSRSFRSRKSLIEFSNQAFSPAFERMGLKPSENDFSGTAREEEGFDHPPLAYWPLVGTLKDQASALASALTQVLARPEEWRVQGKDKLVRPLRAGDIAVLCRSNADVSRVAAALSGRGLSVAVERVGLSRTPHVELVLAAYRWVVDESDTLALAELARFLADDPQSDAWLNGAAADDPDEGLQAASTVTPALSTLRRERLYLTPSELLDAIVALPEIVSRIERWGDHAIRLDDLEALRGCAQAYEAECASRGVPATASGLVPALAMADPPRPRSLRADAVQVMTYHSAKGLEWPMVVLTSLGWEPKARLFEPVAESEHELDWRNPLEGRWIRYWPWPYGLSGSDSPLEVAALASLEGQDAKGRAVREDTRLLYVGVTRARDYLVLAPAAKGRPCWLSVLDPPGGTDHVALPNEGDNLITAGPKTFVSRVTPQFADDHPSPRQHVRTFISPQRQRVDRKPLHLRPSEQAGVSEQWRVAERVTLGPRLPFSSEPDMQGVGEAVHAIFAVDQPALHAATRRETAQRVLDAWGVHQVTAEDVLDSSSRLHAHISAVFPAARLRREVPVTSVLGEQLLNGRIDLLVESAESLAVFDHKSFPGARARWEELALEHAPQLGLYSAAIEAATGRPCEKLYIHMPIVGALLRLERRQ